MLTRCYYVIMQEVWGTISHGLTGGRMELLRKMVVTTGVCLSMLLVLAFPIRAAEHAGSSDKAVAGSGEKTKKPKDKYRFPKIIGQVPRSPFKMEVKGDNLYIAVKTMILRLNLSDGKMVGLTSLNGNIQGFAVDDEYIYFTVTSVNEIGRLSIAGGEKRESLDLSKLDMPIKGLGYLDTDDENVYCKMGTSVLQIPKDQGQIMVLSNNASVVGEAIFVDDTNIYWANASSSAVYMRDKERDIADIYTVGKTFLCTSMAGNNKAFYYVNKRVAKSNDLGEVMVEEKKTRVFTIPSLGEISVSNVEDNGIVCDEDQVYVASSTGVWFLKTGADQLKLIEDTKGLGCVGMGVDDKYIYFTIGKNIYKMTKPKYDSI